ncbi:MAG: L-threonylcarbamoyladenylate synthase [Patescibacteria group bacterium]
MMLRVTTEQIEAALLALQQGGVIVYPSETSYGLGCDARNKEAVKRIFELKGRDDNKALPIIIPDFDSASLYIKISPVVEKLAALFWPGPLNIIAPTADNSPVAERCASARTQSVRLSSHPFVATLVKRFGYPIVATSANIAGQDAIYEVEKIKDLFWGNDDKPDVFIDGGDLAILPVSTTVKVVDDEHVAIVRQGKIIIPPEFL